MSYTERPADGDIHDAPDPTVRPDDGVLHLVAPCPVVRDGVQLTGLRIALGMRRIAARQRAPKVRGPDGLQLVRQLVRPGAGLHDGVGATRVDDDVGVR